MGQPSTGLKLGRRTEFSEKEISASAGLFENDLIAERLIDQTHCTIARNSTTALANNACGLSTRDSSVNPGIGKSKTVAQRKSASSRSSTGALSNTNR